MSIWPPLSINPPWPSTATGPGPFNHRFRLDAENAGAVVALCRQLEGLPLAIELAAARAATVPAAEVLTRLPSRRLDVLRSPRRDAPTRHQDLRAAIGWTYQLLSPTRTGPSTTAVRHWCSLRG